MYHLWFPTFSTKHSTKTVYKCWNKDHRSNFCQYYIECQRCNVRGKCFVVFLMIIYNSQLSFILLFCKSLELYDKTVIIYSVRVISYRKCSIPSCTARIVPLWQSWCGKSLSCSWPHILRRLGNDGHAELKVRLVGYFLKSWNFMCKGSIKNSNVHKLFHILMQQSQTPQWLVAIPRKWWHLNRIV